MSKITAEHLDRKACVYVRQSTPDQLKNNKESRSLQYALRGRAVELGWQDAMIIDEDLGRSASGTARSGFDRLLESVCRGEIGAVLSVDASRLARTGREWHTLLEFCALVGTLIIDNEAIYDPRLSGDRLVLGMKGNMSEMEVSLFRQRSLQARMHKAQRGELFTAVSVGYLRSTDGDHIEKEPDRRIREVIELIFRKFSELHSVRQVHLWFLQERIAFPWVLYPEGQRVIQWQPPRYATVHKVLTNPIYAGAYVYGRRASTTRIEGGVKVVRRGFFKPLEKWDILLKGRHEGYISWDQFEHNQRVISDNINRRGEAVRGSVRRGEALLVGLLRCQHCGRKLHVGYPGYPIYICRTRFHNDGPQAKCILFGAQRVDKAVAAEVLKVLQPEGVRAAMAAIDTRAGECSDQCQQTELALEQARFEAERAKRQFDRVEPENRLVVSELERRWNERLEAVRRLEAKLETERAKVSEGLSESERKTLLELGTDVERAWNHACATIETRKRIVRAVLHEVLVLRQDKTLELTLHWQGGEHTKIVVARNRTGEHRWKTPTDVRALIEVLSRQTGDLSIAAILNRSGIRTAHGHTWNRGRVRVFRYDHNIEEYRDGERAERGEVTLEEAAKLLGVDVTCVRRLITSRVIAATQLCRGAPWIIKRSALEIPSVRQALRMRGEKIPSAISPDQQSLDLSSK